MCPVTNRSSQGSNRSVQQMLLRSPAVAPVSKPLVPCTGRYLVGGHAAVNMGELYASANESTQLIIGRSLVDIGELCVRDSYMTWLHDLVVSRHFAMTRCSNLDHLWKQPQQSWSISRELAHYRCLSDQEKAAKYNQSWIYTHPAPTPNMEMEHCWRFLLNEYAHEDISPFSWNVRPYPFTLVCNPWACTQKPIVQWTHAELYHCGWKSEPSGAW